MDLKSMVGTNYYANIGTENEPKLIHIGKIAYGFRSAFRWNPEYYKDYEDFKKFVMSHQIYNHFGNPVYSEYFIKTMIRLKAKEPPIAPVFKKVGKGDLVHVMKEFEEGKVVAEHHFVDEDFGDDVSGLVLKKSVFE